MVGVKHIEEECECGLKQGMNPTNCSYCKIFAEQRSIGELPIISLMGK